MTKTKCLLYDISIVEKIMTVQFIFKNIIIDEDNYMCLIDNDNKEYKGKTIISDSKADEDYMTARVDFEVNLEKENIYNIKLYIKGIYQDVKIEDNKEELLIDDKNKYIIFCKNRKIDIKENKFIVIKRKKYDKILYNFFKMIYAIKKHRKFAIYRLFKKKRAKNYLFLDRLLFGDDNAEAIFEYICKNDKRMARNSYFVLDKNSEAIPRVKKIGKVLKYGSIRHKIKYINCKILISSHSSYYDNCYNPFNKEEMEIYKDIINKKFLFLGHGIAINDVHNYLKKGHIIADLVTTATKKEQEEIQTSKYMYRKEEVVLTGFARFDKLNDKKEKIILISPTWRSKLAYIKEIKDLEKKNKIFEQSEYFVRYSNLINNTKLREGIIQEGYKIIFLIHPFFTEFTLNFQRYSSNNIEVKKTEDIKYSDLFNKTSILITDYSSIFFDIAYLKKPIIYYQFDQKEFLSTHYKKGYFNYIEDGLGETIEKEDELVESILKYMNLDCKIEEQYEKKINNTFEYIDNKNCERIYNELLKLDKVKTINYRFNNIG